MNTWDAAFLVVVGGIIGFAAGFVVIGFHLEPLLEELQEFRRREFFRRSADEMIGQWERAGRPCPPRGPEK